MTTDFARAAREIAEDCTCTRVRRAARSLSRVYDDGLRPTGISTAQLAILVAVVMFGERGAQISPLADALVVERTTLTRNLKPLVQAGLLRVAAAADDARARVVTLTKRGERTICEAYPLWRQAQDHMRSVLGTTALDELRSRLEPALRVASPAAAPAAAPARKRRAR